MTPEKTWFQTPLVQPSRLLFSNQPLLLRAVDDDAARELRVSNEAAACERRTGAVVHERDVTTRDVDPPHRRGLRHCPEFADCSSQPRPMTLMVRFDNERQKLLSAMQLPPSALVVYVDGPIDDNIVRREPKTRHGGVVANLEVERGGCTAIGAGLEQQCIALRSELVGNLLGGDSIDSRLDLTRRHTGVEDHHIRAEVRLD